MKTIKILLLALLLASCAKEYNSYIQYEIQKTQETIYYNKNNNKWKYSFTYFYYDTIYTCNKDTFKKDTIYYDYENVNTYIKYKVYYDKINEKIIIDK